MSERNPDWEEARDLFFHEDDHAKDRTDWFFIGQAILVDAFVAATGSAAGVYLVGALGLLSSGIWLAVCSRQHDNLADARDAYDKRSPFATEFRRKRVERDKPSKIRRLGLASRLLLIGLPGVFTAFWLFAIVFGGLGCFSHKAPG